MVTTFDNDNTPGNFQDALFFLSPKQQLVEAYVHTVNATTVYLLRAMATKILIAA